MHKLAIPTLMLSALMATQLLAQGQIAPPRGPQKLPAAQPAQPSAQKNTQLEQHAAACLVIGNEEEIAMSEFGEERAQSDSVKEFCREMAKEHTKFVSKLRKFTPQQAAADVSVKSEDAANNAKKSDEEVKTSVRAGEGTAVKATTTTASSITEQLIALKRDKAQHCLSITKEELEAKKGADFDKCFMTAQMSAHVGMLAELRALKGKTSGEFNELVTEAEKSTVAHFDHAKKVMKELESSDEEGKASNVSRPDNRDDRPAAPPAVRPAPRREG